MQDKAIGIAVFVVVGVLMSWLGGAGGAFELTVSAKDALSNPATWATVITALAVAGMAMGVYTNGGLSGANIKQTVLLLIVAMLVHSFGSHEVAGETVRNASAFSDWEWLAVAWLVIGGIRV
jgi:hypothetical protein